MLQINTIAYQSKKRRNINLICNHFGRPFRADLLWLLFLNYPSKETKDIIKIMINLNQTFNIFISCFNHSS